MEIKDSNGNMFSFAHYGEERDLNANNDELQIAVYLIKMLPSPDYCRIVRVSDSYITVKCGSWDLARIKYTDRAKWVLFPTIEKQKEKHSIEKTEDVKEFQEYVDKSYEHFLKYGINC